MPPIHKTVATQNRGIEELVAAVEAHRSYLQQSGTRQLRDRLRAATELRMILRDTLLNQVLDGIPTTTLDSVVNAVADRRIDPYTAVRRLIGAA
jgi:LAO/AO transport system kinase